MSPQQCITVDFGWEFDEVRSTKLALQQVTVGPMGLVSLLATRLGLQGQIDEPTSRIAQYRDALVKHQGQKSATWYSESFKLNPWSVARNMLVLRDFLARFGWKPQEPAPDNFSPRLKAINDLELLLAQEPGWLNHMSNSAGAVATMLEVFGEDGGWDLGIGEVRMHHCTVADLPAVYQRIFEALKARGVNITEVSAKKNLQLFTILKAETEWDAAIAAARILHSRAGQQTAVLAGTPTDVLDREILRRGGKQLGVRAVETRDVVGVFLAALATPHDVQALLAFLQLAFPSADRKVLRYVVSPAVRRVFLAALASEPGVGGEAWKAAVTAFDTPAENETEEQEAARISRQKAAHLLDEMVALKPLNLDQQGNPTIDKELIIERLSWLQARLNVLSAIQTTPPSAEDQVEVEQNQISQEFAGEENIESRLTIAPELRNAASQVETVLDVLTNMQNLKVRELFALIDSTAGSTALTTTAQEASTDIALATEPGAVDSSVGTVLWWAPVAETVSLFYPLVPDEITQLRENGTGIPDAEQLSKLSIEGQKGALLSASHLIAVVPEILAGEDTTQASLISFISSEVTPENLAVDQLFTQNGTVTTWQSKALGVSVATVQPELILHSAPESIECRFAKNPQLVPEYLSHSQITTLASRPFEWLLQYQLLVEKAPAADLPTGNRMVGTFMHKMAENLVNAARHDGQTGPVQISGEAIAAEFDSLLPAMAAEFNLPGNYKEKMERRKEVIGSLELFFNLLHENQISIVAMEAPLGKEELTLTDNRNNAYPQTRSGIMVDALKGRDGAPLLLVGFRDVDVEFADGRRGVIDLKYTSDKTKYPNAVKLGEATQLAAYAASVVSETQDISAVPVGFFLLKQAEMTTAYADFFNGDEKQTTQYSTRSRTPQTTKSLAELWDKLTNHISDVLSGIADGHAFNIDTYRVMLKDYGLDIGDSLKDEQKEKLPAGLLQLIDQYDEQALALRQTGLVPSAPNKYSNYPVITGTQGDFDELR